MNGENLGINASNPKAESLKLDWLSLSFVPAVFEPVTLLDQRLTPNNAHHLDALGRNEVQSNIYFISIQIVVLLKEIL